MEKETGKKMAPPKSTEALLAESLPLLSDYLGVKDIFRVGTLSRSLRETVLTSGDGLLRRSIRSEIGPLSLDDNQYKSFGVPIVSISNDQDERWNGYPAKLAFLELLENEGCPEVENLTMDQVREIGMRVWRFKEDVLSSRAYNNNKTQGSAKDDDDGDVSLNSLGYAKKKKSPKREDGELEDWTRCWYSPTFIGMRGGSCDLRFREVCGFALVFSLHVRKEYKHQYGHYYYHGYLGHGNDVPKLRLALERRFCAIRDDRDIPLSHVPYDFYNESDAMGVAEGFMTLDLVEKYGCRSNLLMSVWCQMDESSSAWSCFAALKDSSGFPFALALRGAFRQLLRRKTVEGRLQTLTKEQGLIGLRCLNPDLSNPSTAWTTKSALGMDPHELRELLGDGEEESDESLPDLKKDLGVMKKAPPVATAITSSSVPPKLQPTSDGKKDSNNSPPIQTNQTTMEPAVTGSPDSGKKAAGSGGQTTIHTEIDEGKMPPVQQQYTSTPRRIEGMEPDVTVIVGGTEFFHYKSILCTCTFFDQMLSSKMRESQTGTIEFPDGNPEDWLEVYKFLDPLNYITLTQPVSSLLTEENVNVLIPWFDYLGMEKHLELCDGMLHDQIRKHNTHQPPSFEMWEHYKGLPCYAKTRKAIMESTKAHAHDVVRNVSTRGRDFEDLKRFLLDDECGDSIWSYFNSTVVNLPPKMQQDLDRETIVASPLFQYIVGANPKPIPATARLWARPPPPVAAAPAPPPAAAAPAPVRKKTSFLDSSSDEDSSDHAVVAKRPAAPPPRVVVLDDSDDSDSS